MSDLRYRYRCHHIATGVGPPSLGNRGWCSSKKIVVACKFGVLFGEYCIDKLQGREAARTGKEV